MAGFKTVGQCEWANPQTDADFRAITPPGFARAFYEANKAETWNTRAPVLSAEEMEMLEGME